MHQNKSYCQTPMHLWLDIRLGLANLNVCSSLTKFHLSQRRGQPIHIKDPRQPLLISNPRARDLRGGERQPAWLVPELCRITGLDERQRNDMKYMNKINISMRICITSSRNYMQFLILSISV